LWTAALTKTSAEVIAIDGKTMRRSYQKKGGKEPIHVVSAFAARQRLVLGQTRVGDKSNEIVAIPALLDLMAIQGAVVTTDAMGCRVEIADRIVARKADYLLALKGNQPTLEADVVDYCQTAPAAELVGTTTVEKGHGRIETRTYTASKVVDWIVSARSYPGQPRFTTIKTIVKVDTKLGFRQELAVIEDPAERRHTFDRMVADAYERGKAISTASYFELDDVIDPIETRGRVIAAIYDSLALPESEAPNFVHRRTGRRNFVDTW
jgi:predicted transposase YbfD/YdcC